MKKLRITPKELALYFHLSKNEVVALVAQEKVDLKDPAEVVSFIKLLSQSRNRLDLINEGMRVMN